MLSCSSNEDYVSNQKNMIMMTILLQKKLKMLASIISSE